MVSTIVVQAGEINIRIRNEEKISKESRFDRHKLIGGWWSQEKLKDSHVFVVGAGALGNEVIKNLALVGVGEITVVDYDTVERSNTSRCVFFTEETLECGDKVYKVDAVAKSVKRLNRDIKINTIAEDVQKRITGDEEFLKQFDVVALALDNWMARISIGNAAYDLGIPVVNGGMYALDGSVFVAIPPDTPCVECLLPVNNKEQIMGIIYSCTEKGKIIYDKFEHIKLPTVATTNSVIGALQTQQIVLLLLGFEKYRETGKWPNEVPKPLWGQKAEYYGAVHSMKVYDVKLSSACEYHNSLKMIKD